MINKEKLHEKLDDLIHDLEECLQVPTEEDIAIHDPEEAEAYFYMDANIAVNSFKKVLDQEVERYLENKLLGEE